MPKIDFDGKNCEANLKASFARRRAFGWDWEVGGRRNKPVSRRLYYRYKQWMNERMKERVKPMLRIKGSFWVSCFHNFWGATLLKESL